MNRESRESRSITRVSHRNTPGDDNDHAAQRLDLISRRHVLMLSIGLLLAGCGAGRVTRLDGSPVSPGAMLELDATAEGGIDLTIERTTVLIDGRRGSAITVNGSLPGPVIRMKEGKEVVIRVHNLLDEATSIHWHGILLPFTMDGVPGISFPGIAAGTTFTYRYTLRQSGTYWYHSHSGMQEQLGLYGMLIIDPIDDDPVAYVHDVPIVLSDWTFEDPDRVLHNLKTSEGYYNFQRQTLTNIDEQMQADGLSLGAVLKQRLAWQRMRMDPTDLLDVTGSTYRYLLNGHTAAANPLVRVEPGQRVRLRIVNASAMTYFDVRIPGLPLTVVQADGQDVQPVEVDELRLAVAETYDVIVTVPDTNQAYTLFAEAMDRSGYARATLTAGAQTEAEVPVQRRRPLLTMADMGMMQHGGHGGHGDGGDNPASNQDAPTAIHHGADHATATPGETGTLAVIALPNRVAHGPDGHGPSSITMGDSAYRRLDNPGIGLGDDGRRVLSYGMLAALRPPPGRRAPTREINLHLTGNMHRYVWGFDGKTWSESDMLLFQHGERLRINFINDTMMNHPLHLHGMWMDLYAGHAYHENPRKHTINIQPAELVTVDITADAPGQWALHCHFLFHMETGMFRTVAVVRSLAEGPVHVR